MDEVHPPAPIRNDLDFGDPGARAAFDLADRLMTCLDHLTAAWCARLAAPDAQNGPQDAPDGE